jgi:nitrous oxidase accessory protein NosD
MRIRILLAALLLASAFSLANSQTKNAVMSGLAGGSGLIPDTLHVPEEYATITLAVNAAAGGDVVSISAGEYDEEFTVDKDLLLLGAGWDSTIIKTTASQDTLIRVLNSTVTIEGLQLWSGLSGSDFTSHGIVSHNATLVLRDCKFFQIPNFQVRVYDGHVEVSHIRLIMEGGVCDIGVQVWNSTFSLQNSWGGSRIDHVFDIRGNSQGAIENDSIIGSTVHWAQGIRLMDSANAVIRNNVILGQHDSTTVSPNQPGGIAMHDESYADISNNEIHGFVNGLYFANNAEAKIYDNIITENPRTGVRSNHEYFAYDGSTPDLGGGAHDSPGHNTIHSNGVYNVENNSGADVFAKYNHWNSADLVAIDATNWDDDEDGSLGEVVIDPLGANTLIGKYIDLILAYGILLRFDSVSFDGITYVELIPEGPDPPPEVQPVPLRNPVYYDITTTARYLGPIDVAIPYDDTQVLGEESNLRLYHYTGVWNDVTSSVDAENNMIHGQVLSLSPFLIVERVGCCVGTTGNVDADSDELVDIGDVTALIGYLYIPPNPEPECLDEANVDGDDRGLVDIGDLTALIAYLYIPPNPEPAICP